MLVVIVTLSVVSWLYVVWLLLMIDHSLLLLHRKVDHMASTEQQLSDDLDAIAAGVATAVQEVADLKDQIAALSGQTAPVSQEQLDALTAKADGIVSSLSSLAPKA